MAELEPRLTDLASAIDWPATPDLRPRVRGAMVVVPRQSFGGRWVLAAVAVLVIVAVLLGYAPTRTAIADWVNLHTRLTRTNTLPTPSPLKPGPIGERLGLGPESTLAGARQAVTWHVLVPGSLGSPDEVYVDTTTGPLGGEVTLVYGSKTGIPVAGETGASVLVTEAQGSVDQEFFGKIVAGGTTVTPVTVGGNQGWWIAGAPHIVFLLDSTGNVRSETLRLAANTLLLDAGGTVVRIEGNLSEAQAEQIAASLT